MNYDNVKNLKVGDKTFVVSGSSYHSFARAVVIKITPKGYIDLKIGEQEKVVRFRPDGSGLNESRYYGYRIDQLTFSERLQEKHKEEKLNSAARLIKEVVITDCRACYGKTAMEKMVAELQEKLNKAIEAVNEI